MITSGLCWSYKLELLQGIHDFREDVIKAALYTGLADLSPQATEAYSPTNEATGINWSAGGVALPVRSGYPQIHEPSGRGVVAFDDVQVLAVTLTFRAVLLYNSSKANRAIVILDKGVDVVLTAGPMYLFSNPASPYLLTTA